MLVRSKNGWKTPKLIECPGCGESIGGNGRVQHLTNCSEMDMSADEGDKNE